MNGLTRRSRREHLSPEQRIAHLEDDADYLQRNDEQLFTDVKEIRDRDVKEIKDILNGARKQMFLVLGSLMAASVMLAINVIVRGA